MRERDLNVWRSWHQCSMGQYLVAGRPGSGRILLLGCGTGKNIPTRRHSLYDLCYIDWTGEKACRKISRIKKRVWAI